MDLAKVIATSDSESLFEVLKTLSNAIPYLGPVFNIILDIVHQGPNDFDKILKELTKLDSHLFAIENKIDYLITLVTQTAIVAYYQTQAERINQVNYYYRRYINAGNGTAEKEDLHTSYIKDNVMHYIAYLHNQFNSATSLLPLISVMKGAYDLGNFRTWMKLLIGSVSQSMILHMVCLAVRFDDHPQIINITLPRDILGFQNLSKRMLDVAKDGTNEIKNKFFNMAQVEIYRFAKEFQSETHHYFANKTYSLLSEKYFWRKWFVLSYDQKRYGYQNHMLVGNSKYGFYSIREYNRNIIVVHTNNDDGLIFAEVSGIVSDLRKQHPLMYECNQVLHFVRERISGFNMLAVINYHSDFFAVSSLITGYKAETFFYPFFAQVGFRVFVIAAEK